jgi:hypothetical protein
VLGPVPLVAGHEKRGMAMVFSKRPPSRRHLLDLLRRAEWAQQARHTPPLSAWIEQLKGGGDRSG